LPELDEKEQAVYKSRCSNDSDLISGDSLDVRYGNVVIIDISNPDKYITYCFTYPEANSMWFHDKTYNVHPYLGYKINQRGMLLSKLYNTLVLRQVNGLIYTLEPISRNVFIREEKISSDTINNFIPTINDVNLYYLKGEFEENKDETNVVSHDNYEIKGKFGNINIKRNNRIINIIRIPNKTFFYKIIGINLTKEYN
jgi:hypothetical protein